VNKWSAAIFVVVLTLGGLAAGGLWAQDSGASAGGSIRGGGTSGGIAPEGADAEGAAREGNAPVADAGQSGDTGTPGLSEADIFQSGAFDQAVQQSKQEEQKNKLEFLFGGVFLSDASLSTTAALDGYSASGNFAGKAFVRVSAPSYGSLYLGYNFSHAIFQGEGGTVAFALAGEDLFSGTFALAEFHYSFDLAKVLFVRVGNQLIAWGPSVIWTPVDFINRERLNPLATFDLRVGKPGVRLHVPLKKSNLFLFTDFAGTVSETPPGSGNYVVENVFRETNFGLRGDLTALGFEFGMTAYLGAAIQNRYGLDFSGRLLGTTVYGELAMAFPYGAYDFSYAASAGFQRTLGDQRKWTLQGEFFYDSTGQQDNSGYSTPSAFVSGGFVPFYVGRVYAYAGITKTDLIGTFLDGTLSGFMNFSDLSGTLILKGAFDIPGFIPFSLSLAYNGGGAGTEFTVFTGENALSLTAQVSLEF
jgi:hypothetical protein